MSAPGKHARRSRLARIADLLRYDPERPPRPVYVGYAGHEIAAKTWLAADGRRQWGPADDSGLPAEVAAAIDAQAEADVATILLTQAEAQAGLIRIGAKEAQS